MHGNQVEPDHNFDPPEDDPEMEKAKRKYHIETEDDTDFDPPMDRDCDYWNRVT